MTGLQLTSTQTTPQRVSTMMTVKTDLLRSSTSWQDTCRRRNRRWRSTVIVEWRINAVSLYRGLWLTTGDHPRFSGRGLETSLRDQTTHVSWRLCCYGKNLDSDSNSYYVTRSKSTPTKSLSETSLRGFSLRFLKTYFRTVTTSFTIHKPEDSIEEPSTVRANNMVRSSKQHLVRTM